MSENTVFAGIYNSYENCVFRIKVENTLDPPIKSGMTFLSVCFFVIPAEAGIQTFFSLDVLQLFYE